MSAACEHDCMCAVLGGACSPSCACARDVGLCGPHGPCQGRGTVANGYCSCPAGAEVRHADEVRELEADVRDHPELDAQQDPDPHADLQYLEYLESEGASIEHRTLEARRGKRRRLEATRSETQVVTGVVGDLARLVVDFSDLVERSRRHEEERRAEAARLRATLNPGQLRAVEWLEGGGNAYLTGCAGTGKSYALGAWLRGLPGKKAVAITATTGIAALNVEGQTLHSWLGVSPDDQAVEDVVVKKSWRYNARERIQDADVLVVDEVSMASGKFLDLAEGVVRYARQTDEPWGGLQVVFVGDFGQLAPVSLEEEGWAFHAASWKGAGVQWLRLDQPMRTTDPDLWRVLSEVREGRLSHESMALLSSRVHAYDPIAERATRIVTHNAQAEEVNQAGLAALPLPEAEFEAIDWAVSEAHREKLAKDCTAPTLLKLRLGARVMFCKNDPDGRWVNGSTGEVVELDARPVGPTPLPARGGPLLPPHEPMVRVLLDDRAGVAGREVLVQRATWERKDRKQVLARREQIPLRLAWAVTAHKTQGTTLERASVDLSRVFTPGQGYVAVSRVRALRGLNIEAWCGEASFRAHSFVRSMG